MKIVHIWWCLSYGGIETMLVNIMNEQAKEANISFIIINDKVETELLHKISSDIKVIRIDRALGSKGFLFIRKLNAALYQLEPDIIHLHGSSILNFLDSSWISRTCCTLHALPQGKLGSVNRYQSILQWALSKDKGNVRCYNRIKYIFSISHSVAETLQLRYGLSSKVIPNGIIPGRFYNKVEAADRPIFRIIQVSRLEHEKKGQDLLIKALHLLKLQGFSHLDLTFIGGGESKAFLDELIRENQLEKEVHLMGAQSQDYIEKHLHEYDLFVQPSRREGFGLTVAEAMAAGVPVLVSSDQGPAEVIENGKYGWVFSNNDAKDLAEKIAFLSSHKEETLCKAMSAQEYVDKEYNVKTTALRYLKAYQDIIRDENHKNNI